MLNTDKAIISSFSSQRCLPLLLLYYSQSIFINQLQVNKLQRLKVLFSMFQVWVYEGPKPGDPTPSPCFLSSRYRHWERLCVNGAKDWTSSDRFDCLHSSSLWNGWRGAPKPFWREIIDLSLHSYLRQCPARPSRSVTEKHQRHGGQISCACVMYCVSLCPCKWSETLTRFQPKVFEAYWCTRRDESCYCTKISSSHWSVRTNALLPCTCQSS